MAFTDEENPNFCLTSAQADAVLKLQLGQLTRLNGQKLTDEKNTLAASQANLENLLNNDSAVRDVMLQDFDAVAKKFGTPRLTKILLDEDEKEDIDMVQNERSVIVVTRGGTLSACHSRHSRDRTVVQMAKRALQTPCRMTMKLPIASLATTTTLCS